MIGEEIYVFPYQDEADYIFNTAFIYETGVLKTYVEPLLYSVPSESPYYEEAKRLINLLKYINPSLIIFSLMSFFLSRSILIGSIAPLGIAFFLGMSKLERYRIPLFISTLAGIMLSGNSIAYIVKYNHV